MPRTPQDYPRYPHFHAARRHAENRVERQTESRAERQLWRDRLAEIDRQASTEIRRAISASGIDFDAALDGYLASSAGARAFAEYCWITDALAGEDQGLGWDYCQLN